MKKMLAAGIGLCVMAALSACVGGAAQTPPSASVSSGAGATSYVVCQGANGGQPTVQITYNFQSIVMAANDMDATCQLVANFLQQTVPYTESIPPATYPPVPAGYIGPPVLTISNHQTTVTITPAWYWQGAVKNISGVLEISGNGPDVNVECQPLYDWLYNLEWQDSFHCADWNNCYQ
ncbi:MAG: hypothetical protein FWD80_05190 [Propionibacteriaceae bacterium]|nr:hypothetical protein [Propionibacteriaceae bacterium]